MKSIVFLLLLLPSVAFSYPSDYCVGFEDGFNTACELLNNHWHFSRELEESEFPSSPDCENINDSVIYEEYNTREMDGFKHGFIEGIKQYLFSPVLEKFEFNTAIARYYKEGKVRLSDAIVLINKNTGDWYCITYDIYTGEIEEQEYHIKTILTEKSF